MKQCTNPSSSSTAGATENHAATVRPKPASKMTATTTTTTITCGTATATATTMPASGKSKHPGAANAAREPKVDTKPSTGDLHQHTLKHQQQQQQQQYLLHHAHHYPLHHHQLAGGGKMGGAAGKLLGASGVDSLSALHMLPAHLRDMFLAQLLRVRLPPHGGCLPQGTRKQWPGVDESMNYCHGAMFTML
uniref:Uncharacterized protein n=1 Tax=Anopheles farauti TaxID=69004 RepID=A0A182QMM2_9DIPT